LGDRPRPIARGRFIWTGAEKRYIRGVTYGTFRPGPYGVPYPAPDVVDRDFAAIAACGANAVRLYASPPRWLLDIAFEHGLLAMVGLAWEQHVAFLDDRRVVASIVDSIEREAASCEGHPAVLCYAIGNEIPSPIVRWHGRRRIEGFLERLCSVVKRVDPAALVTYVNYPSTEYLWLPFLDLVSFNVYLDSSEALQAYLPRLHNFAGDRPLLIAELGVDSRRHGEEMQAKVINQQLRASFASGCAGAFLFSWTDEWHRGGVEIDDWDFGLVDRARRPKPALSAAREAFAEVPLQGRESVPRISVVVCSYNGQATLAKCLEAACRLDYPDYEVIVVDDGSTDETAQIAERFEVRLIRTENGGLSNARNAGLDAATGAIVAFIDDDAWPDRQWLTYLASTLTTTRDVGVGGPNLPPEGGGLVENAVAHAPGGPIHVLVSDRQAEHIPGCNMAFWRDSLQAVRGFDPQFRIAGDDVDICWRLQERGWTLGFSPAAVVLHRRRNSVRSYSRQQFEYGKAEALLEKKWPTKYNRVGHLQWGGRVYGGPSMAPPRRARIHYGTWGNNLFQSIYDRTPCALPLMPEWYLLLGALGLLSVVGIFDRPLIAWTGPAPVPIEVLLLAAAAGALVAKALRAAWRAPTRAGAGGLRVRGLIALFFLLQPLARLAGRMRYGLTPWRRRGEFLFAIPWPRQRQLWSERWRSQSDRLLALESDLGTRSMSVQRGGDYDRWDLDVRLGPLAAARVRVGVEEHGHGRQLVRFRFWPRWSRLLPGVVALLGLWLAVSIDRDLYLIAGIAATLFLILVRALREAGAGVAAVCASIDRDVTDERAAAESLALVEALRGLPNDVVAGARAEDNGSRKRAAAQSLEVAEVDG
jgi:GT2 family glycosyltransferase